MNCKSILSITLLSGTLIALGTGCSTSNPAISSTRATALKPQIGTNVDLSKYEIATVLPFEPAGKDIDASLGVKFAEDVAIRLKSDFGPLFKDVRKDVPPLNTNSELIITGTIRQYDPGSKFARGMLVGMGAAKLKGDLVLKDAADGRVVFSAPFDKLWAWGGILGASKGIEDMVTESEAAAAGTVARAKGWRPPEKSK